MFVQCSLDLVPAGGQIKCYHWIFILATWPMWYEGQSRGCSKPRVTASSCFLEGFSNDLQLVEWKLLPGPRHESGLTWEESLNILVTIGLCLEATSLAGHVVGSPTITDPYFETRLIDQFSVQFGVFIL